jgi:hypothetical protein
MNTNSDSGAVSVTMQARKRRRGRRGGKRVQAARARREMRQAQAVAAEAIAAAKVSPKPAKKPAARPTFVRVPVARLFTVADAVVLRGQHLRADEAVVRTTLALNYAAKWQQATAGGAR